MRNFYTANRNMTTIETAEKVVSVWTYAIVKQQPMMQPALPMSKSFRSNADTVSFCLRRIWTVCLYATEHKAGKMHFNLMIQIELSSQYTMKKSSVSYEPGSARPPVLAA